MKSKKRITLATCSRTQSLRCCIEHDVFDTVWDPEMRHIKISDVKVDVKSVAIAGPVNRIRCRQTIEHKHINKVITRA